MIPPRIQRVHGALVEAGPLPAVGLHELVRVGPRALLGEVIRVRDRVATIQVFEDTTGLATGDPIATTGAPLSVRLGPGLLGSVLDGIGRPLSGLEGDRIPAGASLPTLDQTRRWAFHPLREPGETLGAGDVLGTVDEGLTHRILLPPGVAGRLARLEAGSFTVLDPIGALEDGTPLHLSQPWPVRSARPVAGRARATRPFLTGQRVLDLLFPIAEGGTVAMPGGFGTGKTVLEQSLARHARIDVVVYIGCGERGNEMAEVLSEFPALLDPRNGRPLMERTVLVVNTSNMPVAARESSVQLGLTIAEYYRDMGYSVAVLADSLSRWAEALREIGSRLQEMPGEEGYPTSLGARLGQLVERAGLVQAQGQPVREGALTFIGAISPPGGDFSESVTQAALRVTGALWALDARLARQRQFPAVSWEQSFSAYADAVGPGFSELSGADWTRLRQQVLSRLQRERELREVAELVGVSALEEGDRLLLDTGALLREIVIGQNAYDPVDGASTPARTAALASLVLDLHEAAVHALAQGTPFESLPLDPARQALLAVRDAQEAELAAAIAAARATLEILAQASP